MEPSEILFANLASTRFPSLSVDVTHTTTLGDSPPFTAKSRTLSRFETTPDGRWQFDIMSRVTEGQPINGRFLIEQRSGGSPWPLAWVRDPHGERARRYIFQPWQPFPGSALRWMDHIIPPPGTFTASINTAAAPSDSAWAPPAACWVVDLMLAPIFWREGPSLTRVWIEKTDGRAIDHRVEHHLPNGSVRVIESAGWAQIKPGSPWGPASRIVTDPELGMRTAIQVNTASADPVDRNLFTSVVMAERNW